MDLWILYLYKGVDIMSFCAPLISIVLTTYNSEKVVERALKGIVKQDFPLNRVELIIVDGGSKDNTLKIVKGFVERYSKLFYDVKVIVHDRNYGVSKARNDGIKMSRGRYVLILDHDVVMERNVLHALYSFLSTAPSEVVGVMPLLVPTSSFILDKWLVKILEGRITEYYAVADCILLKRDIIEVVEYYDESLGPPFTIFEEREYGARIKSKGFKIYILGWVKVYHYSGIEDKEHNFNKKASSRISSAIHAILDKKYRYGLKKWVKSMPLLEKAKWFSYAIFTLFIPLTLAASIVTKSLYPLIAWLIPTLVLFIDVLKHYWNSKVLHISLAYSLIAYIWRLIRSFALVIPTRCCNEVSLYRL
jgi:glycosyltransferase involved in cell wall biosynthesis